MQFYVTVYARFKFIINKPILALFRSKIASITSNLREWRTQFVIFIIYSHLLYLTINMRSKFNSHVFLICLLYNA